MTSENRSASPAADAAGSHEFVGEFGWALAVLLREWSSRVEAVTADLPYGTRGYQVLSVAVHERPPTQAALADRLGIDRSVMTHLLDEYTARGLLERRHDPADRRVRRVVATERGRTVLAAVDARVRAAEQDLLRALPERDRPHLRLLLTQLAAALSHDPDRCGVAARGMNLADAVLPAPAARAGSVPWPRAGRGDPAGGARPVAERRSSAAARRPRR
jgi:Transcriptional regulators